MNLHSTFTRPTRSVLAGLLVVAIAALAIGWTAGTVAASSGSRAASATIAPKAAGADVPGVPTTTLPGSAGSMISSSGTTSSIAYPAPGYDSLGVAPQGTILAEGTGSADSKADGSNQAASLKKATDAALADAHAQALAAATSMGVQLQDIYSVSISINTSYAYATPDCVVTPPVAGTASGATASAGSAPASPPVICNKVNDATPTSAQLVVTLIVAYKYA
jgi:hypothetical protein